MNTLDDLPEHWRLQLDSMSLSEFQEFCLNYDGSIPAAVVEHYRETFLWWADWLFDPKWGRVPYDPPGHIPTREEMDRSAERGSFLIEGEL